MATDLERRVRQERAPAPRTRLTILPITLRAARAYVERHHRHLGAPAGGKLAIAVVADVPYRLCGVAIAGRPVARRLDDGLTLEVTRVATDGTANACSALLGAMRRVARALGYLRVITYTRADEPGTSLRAAGFIATARTRRGGWDRPSRHRHEGEHVMKVRWEITLTSTHE